MRTLPLGISLSPTTTTATSINGHSFNYHSNKLKLLSRSSPHYSSLSHLPNSGLLCRASQAFELFPTVSPEIVVREASSDDDAFFIGSEDCKIGGLDGRFSLNKGYVAGILTVDIVADFLPRKGPLRQRRTGIAYISNVAVREKFRRKGIAKRLIVKAEAQARSWGCRAIALHCDLNNCGATKLYVGQGYKSIKVPEGANWPQPKTSPDIQFNFMMKLLNTPTMA
ncbi:uncharacterized protein LOC114308160 isoform X2 [Camellia sinensis]|uniref:uncharacterized protein LOC114308160 isoform X2 n=1 Tax=Camellia sinensis TaxID=4442 RepID=UPI001036E01B|nr:uncharacterized protein LOC114308160 isoform X2 [Camellia sinensis]